MWKKPTPLPTEVEIRAVELEEFFERFLQPVVSLCHHASVLGVERHPTKRRAIAALPFLVIIHPVISRIAARIAATSHLRTRGKIAPILWFYYVIIMLDAR